MYCSDRLNHILENIKNDEVDVLPNNEYKTVFQDEKTPEQFIYAAFKAALERKDFFIKYDAISNALMNRISKTENLPEWVLDLIEHHIDDDPEMEPRFRAELLVRGNEDELMSFIKHHDDQSSYDKEILVSIIHHQLMTEDRLFFIAKERPEMVSNILVAFFRHDEGREDLFNRFVTRVFDELMGIPRGKSHVATKFLNKMFDRLGAKPKINEELPVEYREMSIHKKVDLLTKFVENSSLNEENYQRVMEYFSGVPKISSYFVFEPIEIIKRESTPDWLIEQIFHEPKFEDRQTHKELILQRKRVPEPIIEEVVNLWRNDKFESDSKHLDQIKALISNKNVRLDLKFLMDFHKNIMDVIKSSDKARFQKIQSYDFLHTFYSRKDIPESFFNELKELLGNIERNDLYRGKLKTLQHIMVAHGADSMAIPLIQEKMKDELNDENRIFFLHVMERENLPDSIIDYLVKHRHKLMKDLPFDFYGVHEPRVMNLILKEEWEYLKEDLDILKSNFNFFETEERKRFFVHFLTQTFAQLDFDEIKPNIEKINSWLSCLPKESSPLFPPVLVDSLINHIAKHPNENELISIASKVIGKSDLPLSTLMRLVCHDSPQLRWAALEHPGMQKVPLFKQEASFDVCPNESSVATPTP